MWYMMSKKLKGQIISLIVGVVILSGWMIWGWLKGQLVQWLTSPLFITVALLSVAILVWMLCDRIKA